MEFSVIRCPVCGSESPKYYPPEFDTGACAELHCKDCGLEVYYYHWIKPEIVYARYAKYLRECYQYKIDCLDFRADCRSGALRGQRIVFPAHPVEPYQDDLWGGAL